ncbi:ras-related GTP binding C, isoform CRA_a [Zopfochytrium polystomum]|nr:ras-related GTP binding C, isoform CRA_a [Zopfochytrium polystomum]
MVDSIHDSSPYGLDSALKPKVLLMGLRRCGKSSILNVVFHKMSPNETLFLESTTRVGKGDVVSFVDFQIWDFPAHSDMFDLPFDIDEVFRNTAAIVFVVDAQNDYYEALKRVQATVAKANRVNENIHYEVFIHKVDGLSDDHKIEMQRDIHQRLTEEFFEGGLDHIRLSFYLTTIYDHSIFEAFSKVIQKLIKQLPTLENLLNILCPNSGIDKAFLFDISSKIYIATDSSPVDMQSYELCSDMIDVMLDVSSIYNRPNVETPKEHVEANEAHATIKLSSGMVLYLREVNRDLALVCLIREENFEKQGLIDFNFNVFRSAVNDVFEVRRKGLLAVAAAKGNGQVPGLDAAGQSASGAVQVPVGGAGRAKIR